MRSSSNKKGTQSLTLTLSGIKRRIIPGLLILAAGFGLLFIIDAADLALLPRLGAVSVSAVLMFLGIGYMLDHCWLAFYGLYITLISAIPDLLPQPWSGLSILLFFALMAVTPMLISKFESRKNTEEILPNEDEEEPSPFPELFAERNDSLYQLVRGDECIYVISLGDKLLPKPNAISSPDEFTPGKGRRKIEFGDIDTVRISIEEDGAHIRLKTWTKTFRWDTNEHTPDEIKSLFDGLPVTFGDKVNRLTKAQRGKKESLKSMCHVLRIASWIAGLLYLLVGRPYRTLAIVNIAIPAIYLVIYALNLRHWDLFGAKERENMTFGCWSISAAALLVRAMLDFNFPKPAQLILPMTGMAAAAIALFFLLSIGQRKALKRVLCFLLCVAMYVPGATILANCLLPTNTPEAYISTVLAKDIHRGGKSPDRYEITLSNRLGTFEVNTSREIYDQLAVGGDAVYFLETSILGIESTDVYPSSWLNGE